MRVMNDDINNLFVSSQLLSESAAKIKKIIDDYKEKIKILEEENSKIKKNFRALQEDYNNKIDALTYEINKIKSGKDDLKKENILLKNRLSTILNENDKLKRLLNSKGDEINDLKKKLELTETEAKTRAYDMFKDEIFSLKTSVTEKDEKIRKINNELKEKNEKLNALTLKYENLLKAYDTLRRDFTDLQEKSKNKNDNDDFKKVLTAKIIEIKRKLDELTKENKKIKEENILIKEDAKTKEEEIQKLKEEKNKLFSENESLNEELSKSRVNYDLLKTKLQKLESDFNHVQTIDLELRKQMRLMSEELAANNQMVEKFRNEIKNKDSLNKMLQETNSKLSKKIEYLTSEVNKLNDKLSQRDTLLLSKANDEKRIREKYELQMSKLRDDLLKDSMSKQLILNTRIKELNRTIKQLKNLLAKKDQRIKKLVIMIQQHAENIAKGKTDNIDNVPIRKEQREVKQKYVLKKEEPKKTTINKVPDFLKATKKQGVTEATNKAELYEIISMIKIGVENHDSLEDIRQSLINSNYDKQLIEKAFEEYKKEQGE